MVNTERPLVRRLLRRMRRYQQKGVECTVFMTSYPRIKFTRSGAKVSRSFLREDCCPKDTRLPVKIEMNAYLTASEALCFSEEIASVTKEALAGTLDGPDVVDLSHDMEHEFQRRGSPYGILGPRFYDEYVAKHGDLPPALQGGGINVFDDDVVYAILGLSKQDVIDMKLDAL